MYSVYVCSASSNFLFTFASAFTRLPSNVLELGAFIFSFTSFFTDSTVFLNSTFTLSGLFNSSHDLSSAVLTFSLVLSAICWAKSSTLGLLSAPLRTILFGLKRLSLFFLK